MSRGGGGGVGAVRSDCGSALVFVYIIVYKHDRQQLARHVSQSMWYI